MGFVSLMYFTSLDLIFWCLVSSLTKDGPKLKGLLFECEPYFTFISWVRMKLSCKVSCTLIHDIKTLN